MGLFWISMHTLNYEVNTYHHHIPATNTLHTMLILFSILTKYVQLTEDWRVIKINKWNIQCLDKAEWHHYKLILVFKSFQCSGLWRSDATCNEFVFIFWLCIVPGWAWRFSAVLNIETFNTWYQLGQSWNSNLFLPRHRNNQMWVCLVYRVQINGVPGNWKRKMISKFFGDYSSKSLFLVLTGTLYWTNQWSVRKVNKGKMMRIYPGQ